MHEFMNDQKKFNENLLPKKEDFCSHLNMEDITGADYTHVKRVKIKLLREYHDFFVQGEKLLLAEVLEYFRICVLNTGT